MSMMMHNSSITVKFFYSSFPRMAFKSLPCNLEKKVWRLYNASYEVFINFLFHSENTLGNV